MYPSVDIGGDLLHVLPPVGQSVTQHADQLAHLLVEVPQRVKQAHDGGAAQGGVVIFLLVRDVDLVENGVVFRFDSLEAVFKLFKYSTNAVCQTSNGIEQSQDRVLREVGRSGLGPRVVVPVMPSGPSNAV